MANLDLDAIRLRAATLAQYREEAQAWTYASAVFGAMAFDGPEVERDVEAMADEILRLRDLVERLRPMVVISE